MSKPFQEIYALNECAVTLVFGDEISISIAEKINQFNSVLLASPFEGFITSVPAYCTLTVYYDFFLVRSSGLPGDSGFDKVSQYLRELRVSSEVIEMANEKVVIPVCYGGTFGPDLEEVAQLTGLSKQDVVTLHTESLYQVYMIGFVPGFGYLGGMDSRLVAPRKASPRAIVAAGSVGIAGGQTGIYPLETPGGWQIIGRTPLKMFDATRKNPSLLKAGHTVVFRSISVAEFNELNESEHGD